MKLQRHNLKPCEMKVCLNLDSDQKILRPLEHDIKKLLPISHELDS